MKSSFTKTVRILISLFFVFFLIQGLSIFHIINNATISLSAKTDIQNTVILTSFIGFIFFITLFILIPTFLKRSFFEISHIIKEISKGNYKIDPTKINSKSSDKEFRNVADSMNNMLASIRKFDDLKKEKIIEHRNRILALLHLSSDGFLITNSKGDIIYVNNIILTEFPEISSDSNMVTDNFSPVIEKSFKKYIVEVLHTKTKIEETKCYIPNLKKHIDLNSAIIRNAKGKLIGAIIVLSNFDKKKVEKKIDKSE